MYRTETYADSQLVERIEIERFNGTVEYRRYDSTLTLVETRSATPAEILLVDAQADADDRDQKRSNVDQAVATLRSWAVDARNTTVTTANHEAVTQTMMDRLGVFFDRFADLIETR